MKIIKKQENVEVEYCQLTKEEFNKICEDYYNKGYKQGKKDLAYELKSIYDNLGLVLNLGGG